MSFFRPVFYYSNSFGSVIQGQKLFFVKAQRFEDILWQFFFNMLTPRCHVYRWF